LPLVADYNIGTSSLIYSQGKTIIYLFKNQDDSPVQQEVEKLFADVAETFKDDFVFVSTFVKEKGQR
jgi:hypothetical protein